MKVTLKPSDIYDLVQVNRLLDRGYKLVSFRSPEPGELYIGHTKDHNISTAMSVFVFPRLIIERIKEPAGKVWE